MAGVLSVDSFFNQAFLLQYIIFLVIVYDYLKIACLKKNYEHNKLTNEKVYFD